MGAKALRHAGGIILAAQLAVASASTSPSLQPITDAITSANSEVRTSMFPAVSALLAGVLLIGIAAWVVNVLRSGR